MEKGQNNYLKIEKNQKVRKNGINFLKKVKFMVLSARLFYKLGKSLENF